MKVKSILTKVLLTLLPLIISEKLKAADDFPYGCLIFYNGAERIFTDYQYTESPSGTRHYSLAINYNQGTGSCEATIDYSSPYSGGCSVDGAQTGANVTITSLVDCPLDYYPPALLTLGLALGLIAFKKMNALA
ncbi:hypothetical protein [Pedobacter ghigonis]|uniref:hypothetical protein n=1 Tax=Pedobacter ghigonis TaxID=2730403 RepID=UPI00158DA3C9|nr:hypothetical protein [Pedobacter ghigonis]